MRVKSHGGPNQTSVEKGGDELWIGEKFQSNPEIAGSPRNSFRASVSNEFNGGKALNGLGGPKLTEPYQTSNARILMYGSQSARDKFRGQKGNTPDPLLRSQSAR